MGPGMWEDMARTSLTIDSGDVTRIIISCNVYVFHFLCNDSSITEDKETDIKKNSHKSQQGVSDTLLISTIYIIPGT